jgi:predicted heme/steroid binding protein/rhodanese-related sulfurtransferase
MFVKKVTLIAAFVFLTGFSSVGYAVQSTLPKAPYVSAGEVRAWMETDKSVVLIDVREKDEFDEGHLPGAINIPYNEIEGRLAEFDRERRQVLYCIASSWRAPYSANLLADHGFTNVYVLEGGVAAWNAGGQIIYPTNSRVPGTVAAYPKDLHKILIHPPDKKYDTRIHITAEELNQYDGKNGRPAYVAVNGVIYDLTASRLWRGGEHDPSHGEALAGRDLTETLKDSPHGDKHLKNFPVVGSLVFTDK